MRIAPTHMLKSLAAGAGALAALTCAAAAADSFPKITPDPARVKLHVEAAQKLAGLELAETARVYCLPVADIVSESVAYAKAGPPAAPTKIFDNLYYLGTRYVGSYALVTSQGIVLIDALDNWDEAKTNIEDGLAAFGLKAADIKIVMISHGADDHYGGAKYFQDKYGAKVYMTAESWDDALSGRGQRSGGPAPRKDVIVKDGQQLAMGDTTVTLLDTGGLSEIFNVRDHGKTRMVSIWGTFATGPGDMSFRTERGLTPYLKATTAAKVDVMIANHPYVNRGIDLNDAVRAGKTDPNPYVLGPEKFARTMAIYRECMLAARYRPPFSQPFKPQGYVQPRK
jgi:metallo-beta-lactamase class B